eukprot:TRINITY_DN1811_c1_g2_i7.p1 TRINITY_DN1811_c1_g2~~TRINITY_DN1811_c1_g2_i7.p1  ORF type:complete len:132 (-),score=9.37 TRINITY_DN1811_c1_g2_i7:352-747(-)
MIETILCICPLLGCLACCKVVGWKGLCFQFWMISMLSFLVVLFLSSNFTYQMEFLSKEDHNRGKTGPSYFSFNMGGKQYNFQPRRKGGKSVKDHLLMLGISRKDGFDVVSMKVVKKQWFELSKLWYLFVTC